MCAVWRQQLMHEGVCVCVCAFTPGDTSGRIHRNCPRSSSGHRIRKNQVASLSTPVVCFVIGNYTYNS